MSKIAPKNSTKLEKEPYLLYQRSPNRHEELITPGLRNIVCHSFLNKILNQGLKEPFNFDHMYKLPDSMDFDQVSAKTKRLMTPQVKADIINKKSSIFDLYHKFVGSGQKAGILFLFMSEFVMVSLPWLIKWLIEWIEEEGYEDNVGQGVKLSALITFVLILSKVCLFTGKFYVLQMMACAKAFAYVRF